MTIQQTIQRLKQVANYFDSIGNHEEADRMTELMNKLIEESNQMPTEKQILIDIIAERYNLDPIKDIEEIKRKLYYFTTKLKTVKEKYPNLSLEDFIRGNYEKLPKSIPSEQGQRLRDIIAERYNLNPINDKDQIERKLAAIRANYFRAKTRHPGLSIEDYARGNFDSKQGQYLRTRSEQGQRLTEIIADRYNLDQIKDIEEIKRKLASFRANYFRVKTRHPDLSMEDYVRGNFESKHSHSLGQLEQGQRLREIIADRFNLDPINDEDEIERRLNIFRTNYPKLKTKHPDLSMEDYVRGNHIYVRHTKQGQRLREIIADRYNLDPIKDIEEIKRRLNIFRTNYPKMKKKYPDLSMEDYVRGNFSRTDSKQSRTSKYNIRIVRTSSSPKNHY